VNEVIFSEANPHLQGVITSLLGEQTFVKSRDILPASISLLKSDPVTKALFGKQVERGLPITPE
jgi:hypothetical protein